MTEQDTGFIPRLEALRGVAAVLVGFYHCGGQLLPFPPSGMTRLYFGFGNGLGCVVVFFVISGFVLTRSLDRHIHPSFGDFLKSRFFRLFPAGMFVVAFLTALHGWYGIHVGMPASFDPVNVLLNLLMIKSDINVVMWTMTVEIVATPLIFFGTLLHRARGPSPLLAIVAVLFGLSFIGQYVHLTGGNLAPLYAFVFGMLVHLERERLAIFAGPTEALLAAVGGMLLFYISGLMKPTAPMILLDAIAGALLVLSIANAPALGILKPLDWPIVRFYGRISYSYYLLNPLFILFTFQLFKEPLSAWPPACAAAALGVIGMLMTTLPAYLSWRLIETPGIALGRVIPSYKTRMM